MGGLLTCFDPTLELCALAGVFTYDHGAEVCSDRGRFCNHSYALTECVCECVCGGAGGDILE